MEGKRHDPRLAAMGLQRDRAPFKKRNTERVRTRENRKFLYGLSFTHAAWYVKQKKL
jgi:hypothetical protein